MDNKTKSRIFVGIVAFIMLGSTAGFALFSPARFTGQVTQNQQQNILLINERKLSGNEILAVLNAGRVLIEYSYPPECKACKLDKVTVEIFAQKFNRFVVLSEFISNQTSLRMTGRNGKTVFVNGSVTEDSLTDAFCSVSILTPRECLLKELEKEIQNTESNESGEQINETTT